MREPYFSDSDMTLYQGDAVEVLRDLPAGSVHMACTSPPFFGLRDYQAEGQIGLESSPEEWAARLVDVFREVRRVLQDDGTLWVECGDSYAASMTTDRRMHQPTGPDGTPATNRESVATGQRTATNGLKPKDLIGQPWLLAFALRADGWYLRSCIIWSKPNAMPESVTDRPTTGHSYVFLFSKKPRYFYDAEALREPAEWARWGDQTVPKHEGTETASGWIQPRSQDELEAIAQRKGNRDGFRGENDGPSAYVNQDGPQSNLYVNPGNRTTNGQKERSTERRGFDNRLELAAGKNARTVWQIPTEPNALAICRVCDAYWQGGAPREHCGEPVVQHFAAFPRELVRRMILAGTSERGVCAECGAPWVRETETEYVKSPVHGAGSIKGSRSASPDTTHLSGGRSSKVGIIDQPRVNKEVMTTGWRQSCSCMDRKNWGGSPQHLITIPATILDPFSGSGTTLLVSRSLGRHAIGVELNERYCAMTKARTHQLSVLG